MTSRPPAPAHKNENCALVNFAGEGPYESCKYCTLRIENCLQFRGQFTTALILALIAVSLVPVLPRWGAVACAVGAGALTITYLKYVARESEKSIVTRFKLTRSTERLEEHTHALQRANDRLVEEKAASERLQTQLHQAEHLERIGRMAAGVVHEINNPLTYVIGNLELLNEIVARAADRLDPAELADATESLRDVQSGAERISHIVRDIRLLSRRQDDDLRNVDLPSVVEEAVRMLRRRLEAKATVSIDVGAAPKVFAEPGRLLQVVVNLLTNAADAISGDPTTQMIRVRVGTDAEGSAKIEVCDSGSGIPADKLERIFDPFFSTKPIGEGTGLGLAICHAIVSGFDGRLEVESAVGTGSCFRVTLPPTDREDTLSPVREPRGHHEALRGARILVVDDDEPVGRVLRGMLSDASVTLVTSGEAAWQALSRGPFDLVLCDVHMPGLSGVELFQRLVAHAPALAVRFVFTTGGAVGPALRDALDHTDAALLEKPYSAHEVRALVVSRLTGLGLLAGRLASTDPEDPPDPRGTP
ncbi:MAG: ATP-binding protein [Myxococcota bacterium]